ncbi:MAG: hypothetical protein GPJ54_11270 [Candidatus Heimdallarchaeota archaeon]|nr:hypothetical protein [Candidatus Heimdallarchaeota archaeon]
MISKKFPILFLLLFLAPLLINLSGADQVSFFVKAELIISENPNDSNTLNTPTLKWSLTTLDTKNQRIIMAGENIAVNNQSEIWEFSLQDYTWKFITYLSQGLGIITQDLFYNSITNLVIIIAYEINTIDLITYILNEDNEIIQVDVFPSITYMVWTEYLFIEKHNYLFTFGGRDISYTQYNTTRIFDFDKNEWIQVETSAIPTKRGYQSMVYDPINDHIVLFGGVAGAGSINSGSYIDFADTWVFDFETFLWTEKTTFFSPDSRLQAGMVYDSTNNMVLLFGGSSAINSRLYFDDLWALDPSTYQWSLIGKGFGVGKMGLPSLEYDASSGSIILTGGYITAPSLRFYEDTWEISLVHPPNNDIAFDFGEISVPLMLLIGSSIVVVIGIIIYKKK